MLIRAARDGDISRLTEIHGRCFPIGWSENSFAELFSYSYNNGYVFEDDGEIKGCVIFRVIEEEAEILAIFVDIDFRHRKIGSNMLMHMIDFLRENRIEKVHLEVPADNDSAIILYEKNGFKRSGIRQKYYHRRGAGRVDAITMTKNLLPVLEIR